MDFSLEFVNNVGYVVKQTDQRCFPITKKAIDEGGIQKLMLCISNVKPFVTSIKDTKEDRKRADSVNRIMKLVEKNEQQPKFDTTLVFWPKSKNGFYLNEQGLRRR